MGEDPSPYVTHEQMHEYLDKLMEGLDSRLKNDTRYYWTTIIALIILLADIVPEIISHIKF